MSDTITTDTDRARFVPGSEVPIPWRDGAVVRVTEGYAAAATAVRAVLIDVATRRHLVSYGQLYALTGVALFRAPNSIHARHVFDLVALDAQAEGDPDPTSVLVRLDGVMPAAAVRVGPAAAWDRWAVAR
jgi:hypothetical protein